MTIKVITDTISKKELAILAMETYQEMIKAVVDVETGLMAAGGELHADAESKLLTEGSHQKNLWGINIYFDKTENERVQYTSLINIKPRQGSRSLEISDASLRAKIKAIVDKRVKW